MDPQAAPRASPGATGIPFTVDDVIYSIDLQKDTKSLGQHFVYQEWIK